MSKRERNIAVGTAVAAGIGYVAGILTAPKSGKETRKEVKQTAADAKKAAEKDLKILHQELTNLINAGLNHGKKLKNTAKLEFEIVMSKATKAKQKVSETLSAFHEGEAGGEDLDKAMKEVNKAIEHLRVYIEKADKTK